MKRSIFLENKKLGGVSYTPPPLKVIPAIFSYYDNKLLLFLAKKIGSLNL